MIIEGAFLKLPELLLGHSSPRKQYEATLTSHFAMGVLLELSARNIELPMHRIHIERPYPDITESKFPGRADLYVDLGGVYSKGLWHELYGMKPNNWIEAKYFGGIGRNIGSQTKTTNAAVIAFDLFRLCLYVQELRSSDRDNGRYLLVVFNRKPSEYLALSRQSTDFPKRKWLSNLLNPGEKDIHICIEQEPSNFKKCFPTKFSESDPGLNLKLKILTREFSPIETLNPHLYWGYLVRIIDFEISCGTRSLVYRDASQDFWSEEQRNTQKLLIQEAIDADTKQLK